MTWKKLTALNTMPKLCLKWFCFYILICVIAKNTTSCGYTRLKFTLRNSFYPVKRHQKRSFFHILFANFCILPAFYILFYGNASNFYYRKYFLCLKLCQNYALWKIRVEVIRLCKCRAFKLCNYHKLREKHQLYSWISRTLRILLKVSWPSRQVSLSQPFSWFQFASPR